MGIVKKIADGVTFVMKIIVSVLCAAMLLLMFVEVIRRYVFGATWVWSDELVRFMLVYISMLGGAVAYRDKKFVGFDLILNRLKPVTRAVMHIVINTIIAAFSLLLAGCTYVRCAMPSTLRQVSPSLKIPMVYMYGVIGVAMLLFFLFSLENYVGLITELKRTILAKKEGGDE